MPIPQRATTPVSPKPWYRFENAAAASPRVVDINIIDFIGSWGDEFFGDLTAKSFVDQLAILPESVKTIRLHVNSPGGDVFAAVNMANALRDQRVSKNRTVEVIIEGLAASAASVVIMAGNTIKIADNALVMIHNPWKATVGDSADMRSSADQLDKIRQSIIATYRWKSPLSEAKIGALMDATTWMDADEAIANGFATDKVKGLKAAAAFDHATLATLDVPDKYRPRLQALLQTGRAASGTASLSAHPLAGVSALNHVVPTTRQDRPMTIKDQIASFEATRAAKSARMTELMTKAGEEGVTLDETQTDEYDGLDAEVKKIDAHLVRLAALEKTNNAAAVAVHGTTPKQATDSRIGVVQVKSNVPKGTGFTRYVMAIAAGRGSRLEAAEYAKQWDGSTPEVSMVLRSAITASTPNLAELLVKAAAVAPGSTTDSDWAAPLVVYRNMAAEFIELLRAETILDKITGMRRVPFNISIPRQTQSGTIGWVGQSKPKPVGELKFDQVTLGMAKAAGIIVLNEELVRSSDPSSEALVRADLIATMADYLDTQLLDPSVAEVSNVSPASITNGVTPVDSSGTNYAALVVDVKAIFAKFTAANIKRSGMVAIMSETQAQALSMMLNALGLRSLPDVNMAGGNLFGIPVITSENVPLDGGSPEGGRIIFVSAPNVLLADDGGVAIDVSREASVQMNSTPDDPATASTVMVSLWQNNLVGLRAERFINWKKRRDAAVQFINDANYS